MNIKSRIIAIAFLIAGGTSTGYAQNRVINLEDAILGRNTVFGEDRLRGLQWIGKTNSYAYSDGQNLLIASVNDQKPVPVLSFDELNQAVGGTLKAMPAVKWVDPGHFTIIVGGNRYMFDLATKKAEIINIFIEEGENIDIDPVTGKTACTIGDNLFISNDGKTTQVTNDTEWGIKSGKSTHREEFGITKGTFWSPQGDFLAFYREDARQVTDYPLVDVSTIPAKEVKIKYPMAGMKSHKVTIGVYDTKTGKIIYLQTGEPSDKYLTNISWSNDEKSIYVAEINRDQNELRYNQYDAASGTFLRTLFSEYNAKYVRPEKSAINLKDSFLWLSAVNGYNHFLQYDYSGKLINHINTGKIIVRKFLGTDESESKVFFAGNNADNIDMQVYSVDLRQKTPEFEVVRLTKEEGYHDGALLSADGKYLLDQFSSSTIPHKVNLISTNGKTSVTLINSKNPLADYQFGKTEIVRLKAEDGKQLYGRIIKPYNFDPAKKYPVVLYVYNGPSVQLINDSWTNGASFWMYCLANKGYVVLTVDGRGSGNRGMDFEQVTFRKLGQEEMKDQMAGVNYIKSLPYINGDKIAVHGWSFGGFMTTSLMLNYPDVFKVGVAGGPVMDWKYYEVMYTERYMDTPQANPKGYAQSSLLDKAQNLKGNLMLIHGSMDPVVVWQHSLKFIKSCVDNNIPIDYFVYPGHEHNVIGKDRVHLYNKVIEYIDDKMKKEPNSTF